MCVDIIRVAPTLVCMMVFWQETPVRTSVGVRSTGGFCGYWPLVLRTPTIIRGSLFRWQCLFRTTVGATLVSLRTWDAVVETGEISGLTLNSFMLLLVNVSWLERR